MGIYIRIYGTYHQLDFIFGCLWSWGVPSRSRQLWAGKGLFFTSGSKKDTLFLDKPRWRDSRWNFTRLKTIEQSVILDMAALALMLVSRGLRVWLNRWKILGNSPNFKFKMMLQTVLAPQLISTLPDGYMSKLEWWDTTMKRITGVSEDSVHRLVDHWVPPLQPCWAQHFSTVDFLKHSPEFVPLAARG